MASSFFAIVNSEKKQATSLGCYSFLIEEFMPHSGNVAFGATIDTLIIMFDLGKYEEFFSDSRFSFSL